MRDEFRIHTFAEYQQAYQKSIDQPELFWAEIAENFQWQQKWDQVLD
ncbi:MAG: acetate--CoA ligase, partial [Bacteroidota bacterium]